MCREFAQVVSELWRTIGYALNSYRPELHYMRGPGPKWHAKHTASEKSSLCGWTATRLVASIRLGSGTDYLGTFGTHRFLGKAPPGLGHFDQKRPMLGIIGSARRLKAPG